LQSPNFVNGGNDSSLIANNNLLDDLIQNPDSFIDKFSGLDYPDQRNLLNHIKSIKSDY